MNNDNHFFFSKNDIFRNFCIGNAKSSHLFPKFPYKIGSLNQKILLPNKTEFNENGDWQIGTGVDIEIYD